MSQNFVHNLYDKVADIQRTSSYLETRLHSKILQLQAVKQEISVCNQHEEDLRNEIIELQQQNNCIKDKITNLHNLLREDNLRTKNLKISNSSIAKLSEDLKENLNLSENNLQTKLARKIRDIDMLRKI